MWQVSPEKKREERECLWTYKDDAIKGKHHDFEKSKAAHSWGHDLILEHEYKEEEFVSSFVSSTLILSLHT